MLIFDTEGDDLYQGITKFWVFGWTTDGEKFNQTTDPDIFIEELDKAEEIGCHNIFGFDLPAIAKLLNYRPNPELIVDTLLLSQYLYPNREKHGLEYWGKDLGVNKVFVDPKDWKNIDIELAKKRVIEDVKINWLLWKKQEKDIKELYK